MTLAYHFLSFNTSKITLVFKAELNFLGVVDNNLINSFYCPVFWGIYKKHKTNKKGYQLVALSI